MLRNFTLIFCFIFGGFNLFAQTDLSLAKAIEKALENNYQIKLINTNVQVAELQNNWGTTGIYPTFALNLGNSTNLTDNSNNPASFFPGKTFNDNLRVSLDMNWTIFNGFGLRISKQRFEQLEAQTKGNAIVVIENTIYETIIAYYTAIVQSQKLKVVENLLSFSKDKYEYFKMKNDIGTSTSFDLFEFENQVLSDSSNILTQMLALKNAKRNLNLLMGEDTEQDYNLTEKLEISIPDVNFESVQSTMISSNQNLKNQYINLQLQDLNQEAQKSAYYPVISLGLGAAPSVGYIQLLGDQGFSANTNSINYYANINASYTIFNGWNRKRNTEIAKIQYDAANLQIEELKLNLNHQLKGVYELYETQLKIEDMMNTRVKNAEQLWQLGKDKYDLGIINVFNLNDIKAAYQQTVLSYFDQIFDLIKTHYDLLKISGQISQEFK
ncbi:MAG: TolC family protein [Putridiphycobacter sp.]